MIWANFGFRDWQANFSLSRVTDEEEEDDDDAIEDDSSIEEDEPPRDPSTLTSQVDFGEPDEDAIGFRRPRTEPGATRQRPPATRG